jgi:putative hemolysin
MASQHEPSKGKVSNAPASKVLMWKKNLQSVVPRYWSDVDDTAIRFAIDACTRAGGAIMFGVTTDGGAYSICVLHGQDKLKEYPHDAAECADLLRAIGESFT